MTAVETTQEMETVLADALREADGYDLDVTTYEEGGVMTMDNGLTVRDADGNEYQVTIVRSR